MKLKKRLFNMPVGCILSSITRKPGTYDEEVSFTIKESSTVISKMGKAPSVSVTGGIVKGDAAALMVAMFNFNDMPFKYKAYFNYYSMFGRTAMDRILKQESILFDCIDESCNLIQQFRITNNLTYIAKEYITISNKYEPWDKYECYVLKESICDDI